MEIMFLVELATGDLVVWQISLSQYAERVGVEHTTHLLSPSCTVRCKQNYTFFYRVTRFGCINMDSELYVGLFY